MADDSVVRVEIHIDGTFDGEKLMNALKETLNDLVKPRNPEGWTWFASYGMTERAEFERTHRDVLEPKATLQNPVSTSAEGVFLESTYQS